MKLVWYQSTNLFILGWRPSGCSGWISVELTIVFDLLLVRCHGRNG